MSRSFKLIEEYTNESGVRGLEKQIAKMVRYAAKSIAMEETYEVKITNKIISIQAYILYIKGT